MNKKLDTVIFDFDGVLFDTEDIILKYGIKTTPNQLREVKNRVFLETIERNPLTFMLGIRESIEKLLLNGYKVAIASSNFRRNIETVLGNSDSKISFDAIIGREDIYNPKPHPEVFLKYLDTINSLPEKSIVIEDAPKGIISANRSGIKKVIAIPNIWTQGGNFSNASLILDSAITLSDEIFSWNN